MGGGGGGKTPPGQKKKKNQTIKGEKKRSRVWDVACGKRPGRAKGIAVAAILFLCHAKGSVAAAEDLRAASGGLDFTAIHAVLWAAYEEKIFRKYGLAVGISSSQQREIGHANAPLR